MLGRSLKTSTGLKIGYIQEEGVDEFVFRVGGPEDESSGNESSSDSDDSDFD